MTGTGQTTPLPPLSRSGASRIRVRQFGGSVVKGTARNTDTGGLMVECPLPLAQGIALELILITRAELLTMENFNRTLIPTAFWLRVAAFALAVFLVVVQHPNPPCAHPPGSNPGGSDAAVSCRFKLECG